MDTAIIKTAPSGLAVMRNGEEKLLVEGDSLQWGDKLMNNSSQQVSVLIPAQSDQQTSTVLTLEPSAQAELAQKDTPLDDGAPRTEVLALSDGVELYDVDVSTEVMGLVGAGGGGLGFLGGAGLLAGGLLAGALLNDDDDNNNGTTTVIQQSGEGDVNSDGVDDVVNTQAFAASGNTDNDNLADDIDTDDDNDGVYDQGVNKNDLDGDGIVNDLDPDDDGDGLADVDDRDADNDGRYDDEELAGDVNRDGVNDIDNVRAEQASGNSDGDNLADSIDTDDNNDGVYDEGIDPNDFDGDGIPNDQDLNDDGDLLPDALDRDADNNGQFDDQADPSGGDVAGVTGALLEVSEGLNGTPLAPLSAVTDGLAGLTGMLGDGVAGFEGQDPSGTIAPLLSNTLGVPDPDFNADQSSGVSGAVDAVSEGANTGIEAGALAPVAENVTDPALGEVSGGAQTVDGTAGTGGSAPADSSSPLPELDPTAITSLPGVSELPIPTQLPM